MVYSREESFFGHVHRHPARMRYEHGATADGRLVYVRARIVLDGGAYASSSTAVCSNAACFAAGPYAVPERPPRGARRVHEQPAVRGDARVRRRAGRFAHEAQMDKLAAAVGLDPIELRLRNAIAAGDRLPTGQVGPEPAPVAELLERVRDMPLPPAPDGAARPARAARRRRRTPTHGEGVRRGVGYAVGIKNIRYSEGFDDYSTARVRVAADADGPLVEVHTAAAEVGQGFVTVQAQIARTELGVDGSSCCAPTPPSARPGSTSASRQTWMTGGAVKAACEAVRDELGTLLARPRRAARAALRRAAGRGDRRVPPPADVPARRDGQGDAHLPFAFAAHRAVVDVDTELGLVRVVELATAQDVGRVDQPAGARPDRGRHRAGPRARADGGDRRARRRVLNASFTDYLIPTMLDMPRVRIEVLEDADPNAPFGVKGVGEPPYISTPPAVVAAVRAATGRPLARIPVRPEHIV